MEQIQNPRSVDSQLILLKSARSDKSFIEGGYLDRFRVEVQHPLWGIVPSLSPAHVWDLLEALWIDVSICGLMC